MPYFAAMGAILRTSGGFSRSGGRDLSLAGSPVSSKKRSYKPPGRLAHQQPAGPQKTRLPRCSLMLKKMA
jgi:hypothetical protein